MPQITVEIYSDTLCPFCFIGFRSLQSAISSFTLAHPAGGIDDAPSFTLVWRPFLIHPKSRLPVAKRRDYFRAKYGGEAAVGKFFQSLEDKGGKLGIRFEWEAGSGSSWDSHKLVLWAGDVDEKKEEQGLGNNREEGTRQEKLLDLLFRGVFEAGQDVSDRAFLARCAVEAGVAGDDEEAMEVMESEDMGRRVDAESERARRGAGIEAVPSYLVQGRYFVGGMQEPEVFEGVFGRVMENKEGKQSERVEAAEGEACYPVVK